MQKLKEEQLDVLAETIIEMADDYNLPDNLVADILLEAELNVPPINKTIFDFGVSGGALAGSVVGNFARWLLSSFKKLFSKIFGTIQSKNNTVSQEVVNKANDFAQKSGMSKEQQQNYVEVCKDNFDFLLKATETYTKAYSAFIGNFVFVDDTLKDKAMQQFATYIGQILDDTNQVIVYGLTQAGEKIIANTKNKEGESKQPEKQNTPKAPYTPPTITKGTVK